MERLQDGGEPAGIDPALVRITLAELADEFGERIARAQSGGERAALLEQWATCCVRELSGLDTDEARRLSALYRATLEAIGP